nr:hypothetical protein [Enterococcus faecalis]
MKNQEQTVNKETTKIEAAKSLNQQNTTRWQSKKIPHKRSRQMNRHEVKSDRRTAATTANTKHHKEDMGVKTHTQKVTNTTKNSRHLQLNNHKSENFTREKNDDCKGKKDALDYKRNKTSNNNGKRKHPHQEENNNTNNSENQQKKSKRQRSANDAQLSQQRQQRNRDNSKVQTKRRQKYTKKTKQ